MTGAGAPGGPGIIKCLQADKNVKLTVCDVNEEASGRFLNNNFFEVPAANSPSFIDYILEKCIRLGINVLFPLVTLELFSLAKHKSLFAQNGIKVIVSDFEWLNIANDKGLLHQHLKKSGIATPQFEVVNTLEELQKAIELLGYPERKICIKPTVSNGSRGVRIIDPEANEFDMLFHQKPNSLFIGKDQLIRILAGKKFPELLVAEYLPGEEYTVDTLVQNGELKLVVPRLRSKMSGGISVAGTIVEHQEIISHVKAINNSLKLNGPIGYQFKKASDGKFKLLEINPRIQGTSVALVGAGVNLPLMAVWQEVKIDFEVPRVKWGTRFVRYYNEVYY